MAHERIVLSHHLPNFMTFLRVFLAIILIYVWLFLDSFVLESVRFLWVLVLYLLAAGTDYLDGFFARYYNRVSSFGKWIDPLADKIFVISVFVAYLFYQPIQLWWWMVVVISIRELLVTCLRVFGSFINFPIASDQHAKIKTFFQMTVQILLFFMLLVLSIIYDSQSFKDFLNSNLTVQAVETPFEAISFETWKHYFILNIGLPPIWVAFYPHIPNVLIFMTMCITVYSGTLYIYKTGQRWKKKNLLHSNKN